MRFSISFALLALSFSPLGCSDPGTLPADTTADISADSSTPPAPTGSVIINEVAAAGAGQDWVEFYNRGESVVDVGGWIFTDADPAHTFIFPDGTLVEDGAFLLVPRSETGGFTFGLGKTDSIVLYNSEGTKVHEVSWTDGSASAGTTYGFLPDGEGEAMTLYTSTPGAPNASTTPSCGNDSIEFGEVCDNTSLAGASCTSLGYASGQLACNPSCTAIDRSACVLFTAGVVINEVTSSDIDHIELFNASADEVSLAGWMLSDKQGQDQKKVYTFKDDVVLAAGEFLVLNKTDDFKFGLGGADAVALYDPAGLVDHVSWPTGEATLSYCRQPNGTGAFSACAAATFGTTN